MWLPPIKACQAAAAVCILEEGLGWILLHLPIDQLDGIIGGACTVALPLLTWQQ